MHPSDGIGKEKATGSRATAAPRHKGSRRGSSTTDRRRANRRMRGDSTPSKGDQGETGAAATQDDEAPRTDARSIFNTAASQLRASWDAYAAGTRDPSSGDLGTASDADLQPEEHPLIERSVAYPLVRGLQGLRHDVIALNAGAPGEAIARKAGWLIEETRVIIAADGARSEALGRFRSSLSQVMFHLEDELVAVDLHLQGTVIKSLGGQAESVSEEP